MNEDVKIILEAGGTAPSGDNSQPWNFAVSGDTVEIYNVPKRDLSLYNYQNHACFIAHGALLENMEITANDLGYSCDISIFPDPQKPDLVSRVRFIPGQKKPQPLKTAIQNRATNRKPYQTIPLTETEKNAILSSADHINSGRIILTGEKDDIHKLAGAVSVNERLLFENKTMHDFFFSQIRWTDQEEQEKRNGLFLKTLELKPPQRASFNLFKHWGALNFLKFLKISHTVAKDNAKNYAASAAIGAVTMAGNSPQDYVNGGRIFERLWLTAAGLGLSLQPITGLVFLAHRIFQEDGPQFNHSQKELIKQSFSEITKALKSGDLTIIMMFRIGKSEGPSARSSRLPLEKLLI